MYKILFFVTGIGLGDSTREYAIIQELLKSKKVKVKIAGYLTSYNFFEKKFPSIKIRGFDTETPKFKFEFWKFMSKNAVLPLTWYSQIKKLEKELKDFKPDLIITDFEPLGPLFARHADVKFLEVFGVEPRSFDEFLKERGSSFFTGLQKQYLESMYEIGNKYGEAVIVPTIEKNKDYEKFKLVNPIVRTVKQRRGKGKVVVILGGSSFGIALGNYLQKVLQKFKEQFLIFGWPKKEKIKNCLFLPPDEKAIEYVAGCDAVITLAGHSTICEALVYKKPLLVFPIPGHIEQQYNAWLLKKKKLAMVKELKKVDEKVLEAIIAEFLKKRSLLKKRVGKAKIKGDGAKQAAQIILNSL